MSDFKSKDYGWTENMHVVLAIYELKRVSKLILRITFPSDHVYYISPPGACV